MKKVLSLLLSVCLVFSIFAITASATSSNAEIEYFYFGSYPQSEIKDTAIIDELDKLAPDWESWTSYDYYCGNGNDDSMVKGDWMRYTDVTYGGEKYRGVKFTQYRPFSTREKSVDSYYSWKIEAWQLENGYAKNSVYWFKFEPLKWRILDEDKGFVVCENIIDSQPYSNTAYFRSDSVTGGYGRFIDTACTSYANIYETSFIRSWLNNDFYNTAFTSDEKNAIAVTENLDNRCIDTLLGNDNSENYDGEETDDKIFLLSYNDITNSDFGFKTSATESDTARTAQGSDYAKCQGLGITQYSEFNGNYNWLIRTPGTYTGNACYVTNDGSAKFDSFVINTYNGVRPAMTVDLSYYDEPTTPTEPTEPTTPTTEKTLADHILNLIYEAIRAILRILSGRI